MSSVCRHSPFCLSQQPSMGSQDRLSDCASSTCCITSDCWSRMSDSSRSAEPTTDARSRNANFMLSMLEKCNLMIKPLAALPQADTSDGDFENALAELCCGCDCSCRSKYHDLHVAGPPTGAGSASAGYGERQDAATPANAVRQTNQHQPTERHGGSDRGPGRGRFFWWNNSSSGGKNSQPPKQLWPPRQTAPTKESGPPGCCVENPPPANSDERPLLRECGVPHWNQAEYLDFRRNIATQVFEPLHDPGMHRHMLLLDCHWRLRKEQPNYRPPTYRPY